MISLLLNFLPPSLPLIPSFPPSPPSSQEAYKMVDQEKEQKFSAEKRLADAAGKVCSAWYSSLITKA